ncbi:MAG: SRPBCC family protein, partial [Actinobacteria bacterium]|nr:SRPBCC family protein [Actinomycetota bacterium]
MNESNVIKNALDKIKIYERHYGDSKLIPVDAAEVFAFIDDHTRLSSHMNKSSLMTGGGRMHTSVDAGHGQEIGSHIRMSGKAFGITLFLDEVITHREPPHMKVWETVGEPKLLVVGRYRMQVKIEPREEGSLLDVS